jgi:hypothetical protein
MTKQTTVTINGRLYDAITGQPVVNAAAHKPATKPHAPALQKAAARTFSDIGPRPAAIKKPAAAQPVVQPSKPAARPAQPVAHRAHHPVAQNVHSRPQKSQTLYRKALKKPVIEHTPASMSTKDIPSRSPMISKFNTGPITVHPDLTRKAQLAKEQQEHIAPAQTHPTVAKILQQRAPAPAQHVTGTELKEQLIKERLAEVSDSPHHTPKRAWFKSKPRVASILTATLALLVLGGYLTYMNLPVISMKVAASRAGVDATFPNYRPDGYALNGPITYSPGEVNINYKSNSNDNGFRISQKPSNWDSQALLDNFVTRQTENYLTFQERGVTVYTFGNKAAWVNGGLLYTLDGNSSLSSDQVLRLATSM